MKEIAIDNVSYERIPVKTHMITFGEDLIQIMKKYVIPQYQKGDFVAISEKVVSVCQNNVRHISDVKAGWVAKLLVKGVKKYPQDVGFSIPEKMQTAVDISGEPRMILAAIIGGIGKLFGLHGIFWTIAGNRVSEIDGFNPDAMYPYTEYVALPPKDPKGTCEKIEKELGIPATIIDGNNINVEIISMSSNLPVDKKTAREILLDNPMGQDNELTPFILVRKK
ncbi:MAG TPA: coenzyme F420-0:L-glutamate ligase [Candidatus Pacearchaeota archaeon]|nr:coenzyme F420-0:L-glutamate ligase [Candidatus Pacearchaeota archaeon]